MSKIKVAYQGTTGSHSSIAVEKAFRNREIEAILFPTYEMALEAVERKECDYAVIPMENSLQGSIHSNYYLLARKFLFIVDEVYVPVHYSLIGLPDANIDDLSLIIAHPGALDVCRGYLQTLKSRPNIETVYDSAGAVEMLLNFSNPETAMIGSKSIAAHHQLAILDADIEDHKGGNLTRYNVFAREPINPGPGAMTTVVFTVPHQPGALMNALRTFSDRGIDMTKIESRPVPDQPFQYMFYVDIDGSMSDSKIREAIEDLEFQYTQWIRVLGSYISHKD